jgi:DNA-binding GntR family transcriptional regulator
VEQLKPNSLQQNAYRELKRRIVTLVYRPGEQINTAGICAQLRIGRTPVHLAIHRLELEGLIDILPRRGVVVRPIDHAEIMEAVEARLLVEPQITALATARASEREFAAIRKALDGIAPHLESGDSEKFMDADCEFHRLVARCARNRPLSDLLATLHERCMRVYFLSVSRDEHDVRIMKEHEAIFEALTSRDSAAAAEAMRKHIESLRRNIRPLLTT